MDDSGRERLHKLKQANYEKQRKNKLQNNVLLKECLMILSDDADLMDDCRKEDVYNVFKKFPFAPWGIDWERFTIKKEIVDIKHLEDICTCNRFYIIWNNELPIINCGIYTILKCIDDITAVEADTWLLSENYKEIIEFHHEGEVTFGIVEMI